MEATDGVPFALARARRTVQACEWLPPVSPVLIRHGSSALAGGRNWWIADSSLSLLAGGERALRCGRLFWFQQVDLGIPGCTEPTLALVPRAKCQPGFARVRD